MLQYYFFIIIIVANIHKEISYQENHVKNWFSTKAQERRPQKTGKWGRRETKFYNTKRILGDDGRRRRVISRDLHVELWRAFLHLSHTGDRDRIDLKK